MPRSIGKSRVLVCVYELEFLPTPSIYLSISLRYRIEPLEYHSPYGSSTASVHFCREFSSEVADVYTTLRRYLSFKPWAIFGYAELTLTCLFARPVGGLTP